MAEQHQKTIVGVFALTALVLVGVLVVMFGGGQTVFAETYDINVDFPKEVVGIQDGQSVTLNGKRIGETKKIEFIDKRQLGLGVRIVVAINAEYDLPVNSHVEVASNVMSIGRPMVRIVVDDTGQPEMLTRDGKAIINGRMIPVADQIVPSEMQESLRRATVEIGNLASALTPVAKNLETLLEPRRIKDVDLKGVTANLATVVERFDKALDHLNQIIGDTENRDNLKQLLANAKTMSKQGVEVMDEVKGLANQGKQIVQNTDQLVRRLAVTVDKISSVLANLDQSLASLNSKKGTMGLMLNDNRLYEELLLSARRLTKALDDFREVMNLAKKGELKIKAGL
ncbi:MAG: hypothetical protein MI923_04305 [Phycisphaerales bacterium]|nr:hypothetical protein [Phycisphaerales bacterium]